MNRKEKREKNRRLNGAKGYSQFKKMVEMTMKQAADDDMLSDGDRVMLNTDRIFGRDEFSLLQPAYQEFVKENSDRVFTARIRRRTTGGYPVIIDLVEDDSWSFWVGDLIRVEKNPDIPGGRE